MRTNLTLKTIASELGISVSTVSRALRNHPAIKTETIELVKDAANRLEYFPDSVARSLQQKSTRTIGIIVPEIRHDFFASAVDGIEDRAFEAGYTIIVTKSNEEMDREIMNSRSLVSHRVAGIIASVAQSTDSGDHFESVQRRGIPVVLFDRVLDDLAVSKVVVDDYEGAFKSTQHLIDCGYSTIAHLAGPTNLKIAAERERGYRDALAKNGMEIKDDYIVHVDLDEAHGASGLGALLDLDPQPDAVFAVNDPVAVGAHKEIRSQGFHIPHDIAITGFSNNPITEMIEPMLTTVDQHGYQMGREAADLILTQIEQGGLQAAPEIRVVQTELIVRASSQCENPVKGAVDNAE